MDCTGLFSFARQMADVAGLHRTSILRQVLGVLPMQRVGSDGWEPIEPRFARARDMRLVVAVRRGELPGGFDPLSLVREAVHALPASPELAGWWAMVAGCEIVDLLACDWAMSAPPRSLTGMAHAVGDVDALRAEFDTAPIGVARTLAEAFRVPGLVLPLGGPARRGAYLRRCASGVVARNLDHARELKKLAALPVQMPPAMFVAGVAA